jgi:hypothetical protein
MASRTMLLRGHFVVGFEAAGRRSILLIVSGKMGKVVTIASNLLAGSNIEEDRK